MRFAAISILALPALAAASAVRRTGDQCSGGDIQCCNSTQTVTALSLPIIGGLLGLALPIITGLAGFTCSPLSVLAAAGQTCTKQQVCCTNNEFNGVIVLGCNAINL
ncbi:hypothetical protein D9619_004094 [Psilocybe cf. subviscida]|uniref:Hydrophobin n=1 Tax=Psilocybe cf. subviscida TaxID=2480587 RepID=A0A8H5BPF9_9AGAR|nr:hypothetical protein D9619_004094 [Psilocybe cf. subviscida]